MKIFMTFLCIFTIINYALTVSTLDIMKSVRQCRKENNCQENLIKKLTNNEIPDTEEGLNAIFCIGEKLKLITNNEVNTDILKSVLITLNLGETKATTIANACKLQLSSSSHAEAAKALLTCIKNNSI